MKMVSKLEVTTSKKIKAFPFCLILDDNYLKYRICNQFTGTNHIFVQQFGHETIREIFFLH